MPVRLVPLSKVEFSAHCPSFVDIYLKAMGYPTSMHPVRVRSWRRDVLEAGFLAVCAVENGEVLGIAYGFLGRPEHWWYRQIETGLRRRSALAEQREKGVGQQSAARSIRLGPYFELAEIHVLPSAQGRGVGSQLLHHVLSYAASQRVILSTPEVPGEDNHAFHLYRRFGFRDLLRDFRFTGDARPFAILERPASTTSTAQPAGA